MKLICVRILIGAGNWLGRLGHYKVIWRSDTTNECTPREHLIRIIMATIVLSVAHLNPLSTALTGLPHHHCYQPLSLHWWSQGSLVERLLEHWKHHWLLLNKNNIWVILNENNKILIKSSNQTKPVSQEINSTQNNTTTDY